MPITRHFHRIHHFAYSRCFGNLDDRDMRIHIMNFQAESKEFPHVREILDFRGLEEIDRLTVQGMIEVTDLEKDQSEDRDFRLAMIAGSPLFVKVAQIYAEIIGTAKLQTMVFDSDVNAALEWLGYDGRTAAELKAFMRKAKA
jgi:hypothetical protein